MSSSRTGTAGASLAPPERVFPAGGSFVPASWSEPSRETPQAGREWRILRAITHEHEPEGSGLRGASKPRLKSSGRMESSELNLRAKSLRLVAAVAVAVFW